MAAPAASILVLTNPGIYSALSAVKPESLEGPVTILWSNVCSTLFPTQDGFKFVSNQPVLQDNTMPDGVVFQINMWIPDHPLQLGSPAVQEKQILIVECKRPSKNTTAGWEDGREQLTHYCENNVDGSTRIFGALAIGTLVEFWRYMDLNLTPLIPGQFDLLDPSGRNQAEQCLRYIRTNGWDWTVSGMHA